MEAKCVPVCLTLLELWMLHDFIRHEVPDHEKWAYPPASKELNSEIALAIVSCEENQLDEYILFLSEGDILVIDYNVRAAHKTPEGAKGKDILLKIFYARNKLAYDYNIGNNEGPDTYKEVTKDATTSNSPDDSSDEDTVS